jgi:hypothetical protein
MVAITEASKKMENIDSGNLLSRSKSSSSYGLQQLRKSLSLRTTGRSNGSSATTPQINSPELLWMASSR